MLRLLWAVTALLLSVTPASAQWTPRNARTPAGIRVLTRVPNGRPCGQLLGGRSSSSAIEIWASDNGGANWFRKGTAASNPARSYGDICCLCLWPTQTVFCAFREQQGSTFHVTVCRSADGGANWSFDTAVATSTGKFIGAPFLYPSPNGDLQIYYDSEPAAPNGFQWIYMQARSQNAASGTAWTKYQGVASRPTNAGTLARDGLPSVISLGNSTLMLVCEGVDPSAPAVNCLYATKSFNNGRTWDYTTRQKIWAPVKNGVVFNAYSPFALRFGNGSVGVAFCTDDDFASPSPNNAPPDQRQAHVKFIRALATFEQWGSLETIDNSAHSMYAPGIFELRVNFLVSTVDLYTGVQSIRTRRF